MPDYDSQLKLMNDVLALQFSEEFVRKMKARVFVGFYRYGHSKQYADSKSPDDICTTIKTRFELYEKTGNKEHLIDVANFLMIEYMHPQHPNAHFESVEEEDATKRAGIVKKAETLLRAESENNKGILD